MHYPPISDLVAVWIIRSTALYHSACVQVILILFNNVPKIQSSGAGISDMPQRRRKVLPLSDKVKVLHLKEIPLC
jgi:hypothetical protein